MRKIFKYAVDPFRPGGITNLSLPHGAKFLSLHQQKGTAMVWFEVDPRKPSQWHVELVCRPTGVEFSGETGQYLGTFLLVAALVGVGGGKFASSMTKNNKF